MGVETPIPDWKLVAWRLEELPPRQQEEIRRQVAGDPALQERLERLSERESAFLRRLPPRVVAAEVTRRSRARMPGWRVWVPVLAAAVVLMVLVARGSDSGEPVVRLKGASPHLVVHRRVPYGVEPLAPGDPVQQGDLLQVRYRALGREYGVIVSVDGRGGVVLHHPLDPAQPPALDPEGTVALDRAYELDDAPGYERFFLVTGEEPFAVGSVLIAAEKLAADPQRARSEPLPLPDTLEQCDFLLLKVP